jgi:hypothetical protein
MASKMSEMQQALKRAASKADVAKPAPVPAGGKYTAPSRIGKQHIGVYLDPAFKTSLRLIQAQTGRDFHDLVADALNELFRRHNVPVVGE